MIHIKSMCILYYLTMELLWQVWGELSPTFHRKVEVECFISERTHKPNVLRFWVKMGCPTLLCGSSWSNVDDPPLPPHDPIGTKIVFMLQ
jgi:hypothetical protein